MIKRSRLQQLAIPVLAMSLQAVSPSASCGEPGIQSPPPAVREAPQTPREGFARRDGVEFARWAYRRARTPAKARQRLERQLVEKLDTIDFLCDLTSDQRQSLEAASRKDLDGLFEEAERLRTRVETVKADRTQVEKLFDQNRALQRRLQFGPHGNDTLFVKALDATLTKEQAARCEPARAVFQVGGQITVEKEQNGTEAALAARLRETDFGDDHLTRLAALPKLRYLDLEQTQVTDEGLAKIKGLTEIRGLNLRQTAVTDTGLAHLRGLTNLESLTLFGTQVTDAGLAELKNLTHLQILDLSQTHITDAGLAHMEGLKRLQHLAFRDTAVSDAGVVHLAGLTKLQHLDLASTKVTDAAMPDVRMLKGLAILNLSGTQVTDEGLDELKELNNPRQILLTGTKVTDAKVMEMKEQFPRTDVSK